MAHIMVQARRPRAPAARRAPVDAAEPLDRHPQRVVARAGGGRVLAGLAQAAGQVDRDRDVLAGAVLGVQPRLLGDPWQESGVNGRADPVHLAGYVDAVRP
jgi:hypothetical protein